MNRYQLYQHFCQLIKDNILVEIDSYFEYLPYDDNAYQFMVDDNLRMDFFQEATKSDVKGKRVLEIGTGSLAPLAKICIEKGAKYVVGIESNIDAAQKAHQHICKLGLSNKINIICGDATTTTLNSKFDICVSELIGHIASSEGGHIILKTVKDNVYNSNLTMIPYSARTYFSPSCKPIIHNDPTIEQARESYRNKINKLYNREIRYRPIIYNVKEEIALSEPNEFESFVLGEELQYHQTGEFIIKKKSLFDSFTFWVNIVSQNCHRLSTFHGTHWAPVVMPLEVPVEVLTGDKLMYSVNISYDNHHIKPSYYINTFLYREGEVIDKNFCHMPY